MCCQSQCNATCSCRQWSVSSRTSRCPHGVGDGMAAGRCAFPMEAVSRRGPVCARLPTGAVGAPVCQIIWKNICSFQRVNIKNPFLGLWVGGARAVDVTISHHVSQAGCVPVPGDRRKGMDFLLISSWGLVSLGTPQEHDVAGCQDQTELSQVTVDS